MTRKTITKSNTHLYVFITGSGKKHYVTGHSHINAWENFVLRKNIDPKETENVFYKKVKREE